MDTVFFVVVTIYVDILNSIAYYCVLITELVNLELVLNLFSNNPIKLQFQNWQSFFNPKNLKFNDLAYTKNKTIVYLWDCFNPIFLTVLAEL